MKWVGGEYMHGKDWYEGMAVSVMHCLDTKQGNTMLKCTKDRWGICTVHRGVVYSR
jgi:hypothetical protein